MLHFIQYSVISGHVHQPLFHLKMRIQVYDFFILTCVSIFMLLCDEYLQVFIEKIVITLPRIDITSKSDVLLAALDNKTAARTMKFLQPIRIGSPARTRTTDMVVNSHPLYRLSYWGMIIYSLYKWPSRPSARPLSY
jgi:hypothetical protein